MKLLMLHHLNFSIQLDGMGTTEFLMSMTKNEAPHLDGGINVTQETQQPLPFEILCQRPFLRMVSNMYITGHILNGWPRAPSLIRSCNGNPGRWGAPFSLSTPPHTHTIDTQVSSPPYYFLQLRAQQNTVTDQKEGDGYFTGFPRINNIPLNDITENYLPTRFSMKRGFSSPKCTWVFIAVQVKQNVTSDVINS